MGFNRYPANGENMVSS